MLGGADLSGAKGLDQDQLDEACGDGGTRLPRGLSLRKSCHGDRRSIRVSVDFQRAQAEAARAGRGREKRRAAAALGRRRSRPRPGPPKPPKY
jgi:hypothetical protein